MAWPWRKMTVPARGNYSDVGASEEYRNEESKQRIGKK
jgi:hypothetical protein